MQEKNATITNQELAEAFTDEASNKKAKYEGKKPATGGDLQKRVQKSFIIMLVVGGVGLLGGVAMLLYGLLGVSKAAEEVGYPDLTPEKSEEVVYSALTGEKLADASLVTAPAYCIQTPNGTDGARPQAGLNQAGVIFEAIAESGITRFAAIYQNPTAAIIGPIRSLRIYYLEWDTPFDCTIVHAGGSGDALAAVSAGGYKDLSEDYNYMYRGTYGSRLWNNLFTTSGYLAKYSADHGYNTSEIKGFVRMTPEESAKARMDALAAEKLVITKAASGDTAELKPAVTHIGLQLGGWASFNVDYNYDTESNRYSRSYGDGNAHEVYNCPEGDLGEKNPEDACNLVQMAPSVVVALVVNERRASDNYHEDIDVIGSGDAYIFQNGTAVKGTWKKSSKSEQISFTDEAGSEIKLAPGQTILTAVPSYGSIDF
ncbi:DUF3048 domain-containing protein [Candidatus Saccharibacteria bacterium]|nr:DUF3048 domain-containing protein [Candidatus Saccharibacteria bacterium]